MASAVDICNLALQRLGAKSIGALTEDTTAGRECNRVYEHARDSELRSHEWSFARTRIELAADSAVPSFGYAVQYTLPSDYVRLLPARTVTNDTTSLGGLDPNIDWQIEGRKILTNDTAPLQIVYLKKVTDPNDFDELFTDVLVSRIAMDVAEKITQSNTKKTDAQNRYTLAKQDAKRINAYERPPQESPTDEWIVAR
jgi:hypothetical protein